EPDAVRSPPREPDRLHVGARPHDELVLHARPVEEEAGVDARPDLAVDDPREAPQPAAPPGGIAPAQVVDDARLGRLAVHDGSLVRALDLEGGDPPSARRREDRAPARQRDGALGAPGLEEDALLG